MIIDLFLGFFLRMFYEQIPFISTYYCAKTTEEWVNFQTISVISISILCITFTPNVILIAYGMLLHMLFIEIPYVKQNGINHDQTDR